MLTRCFSLCHKLGQRAAPLAAQRAAGALPAALWARLTGAERRPQARPSVIAPQRRPGPAARARPSGSIQEPPTNC
jgi:hypothetical protein